MNIWDVFVIITKQDCYHVLIIIITSLWCLLLPWLQVLPHCPPLLYQLTLIQLKFVISRGLYSNCSHLKSLLYLLFYPVYYLHIHTLLFLNPLQLPLMHTTQQPLRSMCCWLYFFLLFLLIWFFFNFKWIELMRKTSSSSY